MSTNAYIGIKQNDGAVKAIYVHWDGGLWAGGVGETLLRYYEEGDTQELMEIGSVSALCPTVEETKTQAYGEQSEIFSAEEWDETSGYCYLWDGTKWMLTSGEIGTPQPLDAALSAYQAQRRRAA